MEIYDNTQGQRPRGRRPVLRGALRVHRGEAGTRQELRRRESAAERLPETALQTKIR